MFIDKHITPKLGKIRLDAAVREKLILSGPAMLGHSNAGFTLATYTHTTTAAQHQAAAIMGNLVGAGVQQTEEGLRITDSPIKGAMPRCDAKLVL